MPNAVPAPRRTEMLDADAFATVACPSCAATYRVPIARATEGWMRCSACHHVWSCGNIDDGTNDEAPVPAHTLPDDADDEKAADPIVDNLDEVDAPALAAQALDETAMTADEIEALLSDDMEEASAGASPQDGAPQVETRAEHVAASTPDDEGASAPRDLEPRTGHPEDAPGAIPKEPADRIGEDALETGRTPSNAEEAVEDGPEATPVEATPIEAMPIETMPMNVGNGDGAAPDDEPAAFGDDPAKPDGGPADPDDDPTVLGEPAAPVTRQGRAGPLAARVAASALLLSGIGAAVSGYVARESVVRAQPKTAVLFDALGTPVNLTPFDFAASDARLAVHGDRDHLSMTVSVRNIGKEPRPVPALDLVLRDADGRAVERSALRVPTDLVRGLDTISFKAQVDLDGKTDPRRVVDAVVAMSPPPVQRAAHARLQPIGQER